MAWADVAGIGLAAQTETFVVWDRATGRAAYPAISWRDGRGAGLCEQLRAAGHEPEIRRRTGLPLAAAFSAPKLRWVLDEVPGARAAAEAGELLFGDVNCWLTWNLSGGAAHVTEPSMAARTMLFDTSALAWDAGLLEAERLLGRYGSCIDDLLALIGGRPELASPLGRSGYLAAEIVYACTHEGAVRLDDVLARRTRIAIETRDRGLAAAAPAAALMAAELGWDDARTSREVAQYGQAIAAEQAAQGEPDDRLAYQALVKARDPVPFYAARPAEPASQPGPSTSTSGHRQHQWPAFRLMDVA